jgi:hypothetical protein
VCIGPQTALSSLAVAIRMTPDAVAAFLVSILSIRA